METTAKGLKKFDEEEFFDMEQFNNDNMDKINDLLACDYVVDSYAKLLELYPPSASLLNKRARVKDTNKIYVVKLNGTTYSWVTVDDSISALDTKITNLGTRTTNLESRATALEEKVVVQLIASSFSDLTTRYPASATYLNKKCLVTDTNTIYKCKLKDGTYSWEEDSGTGGSGDGFIVVDDKSKLPTITESAMHKLYYAKYEEQFFYIRAINGVGGYQVWSFDNQETFNIDSTWYNYQHTLDTDKWYKGSRKTTEKSCTVIEGTITPSGTYSEGALIVCYQDEDNCKLYKYTSGSFLELTNLEACNFNDVSLYSVENDTYYYYIPSKRLVYFEHTDWVEADVTNYNSTERPPINIHTQNKMFGTQKPELVKILMSQNFSYAWEPLCSDYDLKLLQQILEAEIDTKLTIESYPDWGNLDAREDRMGKLFYNKANSYYMFVNRTSVSSATIAQQTEGSYQEGLLANRPGVYGTCRVYYATDVDKYYVVKGSGDGGGLLTQYWDEVEMHIQSWTPTVSGANIGYYLFGSSGSKYVLSIYGTYEWVELNKPFPCIYAQSSSGSYNTDEFFLKRIYLYYDEKDVDSMTEGYLYGVIEDV